MTHAIRIHRFGGPEVLQWEPIEVGEPGPGEVRLRHTAAGLNFVDTMQRRGMAHPLPLPLVLGRGGAGVVESLGSGVAALRPGDRVAYAPHTGSYAEARVIGADKLVKIPDGLDERMVAATMLQGLTAQFLLRQVHAVAAGESIFVHAAAGGLGSILCRWAARLGARVVGGVSNEAKAAVARANGCRETVIVGSGDFAAEAVHRNGGKFDVVYDSVGKDTFLASLDMLRPAGLIASCGISSGEVPRFGLDLLREKGALSVSTGALLAFTEGRGKLREMAQDWFEALRSLEITINQTYALRDAAQAHRDIEARRTTGSTVLLI